MANPNVNDYDKSLNDYFNKIKDFKPYTLKEEITLWEDYKKNNNFSSRNKLFNANFFTVFANRGIIVPEIATVEFFEKKIIVASNIANININFSFSFRTHYFR